MSADFKEKLSQHEHVGLALTQLEVLALMALIGELPGHPENLEDRRVDDAFERVWQRLKLAAGLFPNDDDETAADAERWVKGWLDKQARKHGNYTRGVR